MVVVAARDTGPTSKSQRSSTLTSMMAVAAAKADVPLAVVAVALANVVLGS